MWTAFCFSVSVKTLGASLMAFPALYRHSRPSRPIKRQRWCLLDWDSVLICTAFWCQKKCGFLCWSGLRYDFGRLYSYLVSVSFVLLPPKLESDSSVPPATLQTTKHQVSLLSLGRVCLCREITAYRTSYGVFPTLRVALLPTEDVTWGEGVERCIYCLCVSLSACGKQSL